MKWTSCLIALAFLCCHLRAIASPLESVHPADDSSSGGDKTPNLLTMLDAFKGDSPVDTLMNILKEFKAARDGLKKYMAVSPLMKNIIDTAAKKNIKLNIMVKMVNGEYPDIEDLYKLATQKTNSILLDIQSAKESNPQWKQLMNLRREKGALASADKVEEMIKLFFGKKLTLKPSDVKELSAGTYVVSPSNIALGNVMEITYFVLDNWVPFIKANGMLIDTTVDFDTYLQVLNNLNFSHLLKVKAIPKTVHDGKYSVGGTRLQMDPDVAGILQDLKTGQALAAQGSGAGSKVEQTVMDIISRFSNVFVRSLQQVEATGGATPDQQGSSAQNTIG